MPQVVAHSVEIVRAVVRVETTGQAEVRVSMEDEREIVKETRSRRTLSEGVFRETAGRSRNGDAVRAILDGAVERGALSSSGKGQFPFDWMIPKDRSKDLRCLSYRWRASCTWVGLSTNSDAAGT